MDLQNFQFSSKFDYKETHVLNLSKLLPFSYLYPHNSNNPFAFLFETKKLKINTETIYCFENSKCSILIRTEYDRILCTCLNLLKHLSGRSMEENFGIQETILELIPHLANLNREQFNSVYLKKSLNILSELSNKSFSHKTKLAICVGSISIALSNTSIEFNNFSRKFLDSFFSSSDMKLKTNELNSIYACATMFRKSLLSENSKNFNIDDSIEFSMNKLCSMPYYFSSTMAFLKEVLKFYK